MVYAKRKKAKKRPKEDLDARPAEEIVGVVDRFVQAVAEQWKPIAIVLVAAAVVLGSMSIYKSVRAGKEDAAAADLYDAELKLPDPVGFSFDLTGNTTEADRQEDLREAVTEFDGVAEEHGDTVGSDLARLEGAHALLQLGEHDAAAERYAEAAASSSDMVRSLALAGQATALESAERYGDEQAVLRELIEHAPGALGEHAYLDLIRAHELAGDDAGALAVCREFEEKLPDSPLIGDVQGKIRTLGGEPTSDAGEGAAEVAPADGAGGTP
jgi:tetratricopeptide (TPR) repeat protein